MTPAIGQKKSASPIPTGRKNQTKAQVASYLGVSIRFVEKLMSGRRIPFRRISRRCIRLDLDAIDHALAKFDIKEMGVE